METQLKKENTRLTKQVELLTNKLSSTTQLKEENTRLTNQVELLTNKLSSTTQLKEENTRLTKQVEHLTNKLSFTTQRFKSESSALGQCLTNQTVLAQALQDVEQQLETALQQNLAITSASSMCKNRLNKKASLIATVRQQGTDKVSNLTAKLELQEKACATKVEKLNGQLASSTHSQQLEIDILRQTLRTSNYSFIASMSLLQHNHSQELTILHEQAQANLTSLRKQLVQAATRESYLETKLQMASKNITLQLQRNQELILLQDQAQVNFTVLRDKYSQQLTLLHEQAQANVTTLRTQLKQAAVRESRLETQLKAVNLNMTDLTTKKTELTLALNQISLHVNRLEDELLHSITQMTNLNETNKALTLALKTLSIRANSSEYDLRKNETLLHTNTIRPRTVNDTDIVRINTTERVYVRASQIEDQSNKSDVISNYEEDNMLYNGSFATYSNVTSMQQGRISW